MRWALVALLSVALPVTAGTSKSSQSDPSHGINFYSIERELALGRQLSDELERQVRLVDDLIVSEYINRVAQNIARQADIKIPISVRIIESGDMNAFTLPGGHIYVNSAMLKLTESEAELAFVIAHEIGHVAARHATREATRGDLIQLGSIPAMIFGGWTGVALRQLAGHGSQLGMAKSSRVFETQADRLGIEFLEAAGYDSSAATDLFERIEATERKQPGAVERLYSSHPVTPARIQQVQKELASLKSNRTDWVINTSEYEEKRRRVVEIERRREAAEQAHKPTLVH